MQRFLSLLAMTILLSACGGSSRGGDGGSPASARCAPTGDAINHAALLELDCPRLADYNLFEDPADPTANPRERGLRYELATPLFSNYTSKYRFVFIPAGAAAVYHDTDAFEFPVGTVISKTFALPTETAYRDPENETLLETRLMIRRAGGWVGLPYVWNAERTEAVLRPGGRIIDTSVIHNGQQMDFKYQVPSSAECIKCHQTGGDDAATQMTLIGPKARSLTHEEGVALIAAWINRMPAQECRQE